MEALNYKLQHLDGLAMTYAQTPKNNKLENEILTAIQDLFCNHIDELKHDFIDMPNILIEYCYAENDCYYEGFELLYVVCSDAGEDEIEIEADFSELNDAVNAAFWIANQDGYQYNQTLKNL